MGLLRRLDSFDHRERAPRTLHFSPAHTPEPSRHIGPRISIFIEDTFAHFQPLAIAFCEKNAPSDPVRRDFLRLKIHTVAHGPKTIRRRMQLPGGSMHPTADQLTVSIAKQANLTGKPCQKFALGRQERLLNQRCTFKCLRPFERVICWSRSRPFKMKKRHQCSRNRQHTDDAAQASLPFVSLH